MQGERISYHESVRRVYDRIKADGMNNIWDRYEAQGMGGNPDQRCPSAIHAGPGSQLRSIHFHIQGPVVVGCLSFRDRVSRNT